MVTRNLLQRGWCNAMTKEIIQSERVSGMTMVTAFCYRCSNASRNSYQARTRIIQ